MSRKSDYQAFLESKRPESRPAGFDVDEAELNPLMKPFQRG
jgi:hypothetical protein